MDKDKSSQSKVTLEQLLRIKRAERPTQDFWEGFERDLRHKQLAAAIVEERPWWRSLTGGLAKIYVPVGAVAAVAFAMVMMRSDRTALPVAVGVGAGSQDATVVAVGDGAHGGGIAPSSLHASNEPASLPAKEGVAVVSVRSAPDVGVPQPRSDAQTFPARTDADASDGMLALSSTSAVAAAFVGARNEIFRRQSIAALQVQSGNGDSIVATPILALFEAVSPSVEAEADNATSETDYLHRLASSANPRSSRLLAYADPVSESEMDADNNPRLARARERITSRLNDRALVDSSSRFGAADGKVSIKF
ncbi:hypothetical protein OH491_04750 [Termitidicoccus mucosus]|uniref:Uncharacterized protein n=1 Tax=Termitidicoccus mucosus TaxID=1184151 RepID=A0A178IMV8_9BACT|nr:hypothetical protein AW736_04850 [Opitutaceae bacterium TSB47]